MGSTWLIRGLAVIALLGLGACSTAHSPQIGTESGNPPLIDSQRISLQLTDGKLLLKGKAGAISPVGASLEIIDLTSGEVFQATAKADGSFSVVVSGSREDSFSVRASAGKQSSNVVYVVAGAVGDGTDGTLSCMQREALAGQTIRRATQLADTICSSDRDCKTTSLINVCHDACSTFIGSKTGVAAVEAVVSGLETSLCAQFEQDGCSALALPCAPPASDMAQCVGGYCMFVAPECAACDQPSIRWGTVSSQTDYNYQSQLTDCTHYSHSRVSLPQSQPGAAPSCTSDFPCHGKMVDRAMLQSALLADGVQRILTQSHVVYGLVPGPADGSVTTIVLGHTTIEVGSDCGDVAGCLSPPDDLASLQTVLHFIDGDRSTSSECGVFSGKCLFRFDAGTGTGSSTVYWHDPQSLACLPRTYLGSGGNANRFASRDECEARCGTPIASQCGDRVFAASACTECGLVGGCGDSTSACAVMCTRAADCAGEALGAQCSPQGICEHSGCL